MTKNNKQLTSFLNHLNTCKIKKTGNYSYNVYDWKDEEAASYFINLSDKDKKVIIN